MNKNSQIYRNKVKEWSSIFLVELDKLFKDQPIILAPPIISPIRTFLEIKRNRTIISLGKSQLYRFKKRQRDMCHHCLVPAQVTIFLDRKYQMNFSKVQNPLQICPNNLRTIFLAKISRFKTNKDQQFSIYLTLAQVLVQFQVFLTSQSSMNLSHLKNKEMCNSKLSPLYFQRHKNKNSLPREEL